MGNETDQLKDHAYDGIQEYDNPLPAWWLATFFITIIFSFLYWIHYEFSGGQTQYQELKSDLAHYESLKKSAPAPQESEEDLVKLVASNEVIKEGEGIYTSRCAACHGPQLQGSIGPNLVDDYWIHGTGRFTDIMSVVVKGVLDKGMPNWESLLNPKEIKAVTAFILKHQGSSPPNPKAPQGEKVAGQRTSQ